MISDAAAFVVRTWESTPQRLSVLRFPFFTEKKTVFKFCTNNCNYLGFQQRTIYVVSMGIDSLAYNMQITHEHVLLILRCGFIYSSYVYGFSPWSEVRTLNTRCKNDWRVHLLMRLLKISRANCIKQSRRPERNTSKGQSWRRGVGELLFSPV